MGTTMRQFSAFRFSTLMAGISKIRMLSTTECTVHKRYPGEVIITLFGVEAVAA